MIAMLCSSGTVPSRKAEPHIRLHVILWDTRPGGVQYPEVGLATGVAFFSGSSEPFCRFAIILSYAMTGEVHRTQINLGSNVTLSSQGGQQSQRSLKVSISESLVASLRIIRARAGRRDENGNQTGNGDYPESHGPDVGLWRALGESNPSFNLERVVS